MHERPIGEVLTNPSFCGEYIAVRARRLPDGSHVGKIIESGTDPDAVHGILRQDMKDHQGTGAGFTYYFYKPFMPGEDREGWIVDMNGDKK